MKEIGQFLGKFNSIAIKEIRKREVICEIIKKNTKQEIDIKDISFSNKKLKINGTSVFKSQILIKKQIILKEIKKIIPNIDEIN